MNLELLNIDKTKKLIVSIKKSIDKLDDQIHLAGCSGLHHCADNGDATLLTQLAKATSRYTPATGQFDGRSVRGSAIRHWICINSNLVWQKKAYGEQGGFIKKAGEDKIVIRLQDAIDTPFYSLSEDKVPSEFLEWFKRSNGLVNSLSSALEAGRIKDGDIPQVIKLIETMDLLLKGHELESVQEEYEADDVDNALAAAFNLVEDDLDELKAA